MRPKKIAWPNIFGRYRWQIDKFVSIAHMKPFCRSNSTESQQPFWICWNEARHLIGIDEQAKLMDHCHWTGFYFSHQIFMEALRFLCASRCHPWPKLLWHSVVKAVEKFLMAAEQNAIHIFCASKWKWKSKWEVGRQMKSDCRNTICFGILLNGYR